MSTIKLSPNFTLEEMVRSEYARRQEMKNEPHERHIEAMRLLCEKVLEPLRKYMGMPIFINSGYRTPELCERIGSSRRSRHTLGQAADIVFLDKGFKYPPRDAQSELLGDAAKYLVDMHTGFDGLILEAPGGDGIRWLHVSYDNTAKDDEQRQKMVFYDGRKYLTAPSADQGKRGTYAIQFAKARGDDLTRFMQSLA